MNPTPHGPPVRQALAVLFDHPELLTLDPSRVHAVQQLIAGTTDGAFAEVWQYISGHPLDGDDPWAGLVPIVDTHGNPITDADGEPLNSWTLAAGLGEAIRGPLATVLPQVRGPAPARVPVTGRDLAPAFGLSFPSLRFDAATATCTLQIANSLPRHAGVYVAFFADGKPVPISRWTSRLPSAAAEFGESDTVKYLGAVPPGVPIAGMTVPDRPSTFSFPVPDPGLAVRLSVGGPGLDNLDLMVDAAGVLLTAVLDHAVPLILDGAGAALTKQAWFAGLLADPAITAEILTAGRFLFSGAPPVDTAGLLDLVGSTVGTLLLGGALPTLAASIAKHVGATAAADAAPVLGWSEAELAAQSVERLQAQTSTRVLSCPATYWLDLVPATSRLVPDPAQGVWPDQASTYRVGLTVGGETLAPITGSLPAGSGKPIDAAVALLPAGRPVTADASVFGVAGQAWGHASAAPWFLPAADQPASAAVLQLSDTPASIAASTHYSHWRKLTYLPDRKLYRWQEAPAPTADRLLPAPGASFRALAALTLQERSGDLGYAWQDGGSGARFVLRNIGVADPQARLADTGPVLGGPAALVYDTIGPAAAAAGGTGWNFYLDPASYAVDGRFHLRSVTLDGSSAFDLDQSSSWGAFGAESTQLIVHPAGAVVACLFDHDVVEVLPLPPAAVPAGEARSAAIVLGPGTGVGAVRAPVAAAVTSNGTVVVLESGNARVQAVDVAGNPVPCFAGGSPVSRLRAEDAPVRYLDMAVGPDDTIYVLLCLGDTPAAADYCLDLYRADGSSLSRTAGVAAARLVVDSWGRVYTLNYEAIKGPQDRLEPTVSQWLPTNQ